MGQLFLYDPEPLFGLVQSKQFLDCVLQTIRNVRIKKPAATFHFEIF